MPTTILKYFRSSDPFTGIAYTYSGTSDKGLSEIGTTSQLRTQFWTPFPWQQFIFNLRAEDNLSTEAKMAGPKVSFTQRFHCIPALPWKTLKSHTHTHTYTPPFPSYLQSKAKSLQKKVNRAKINYINNNVHRSFNK